MLNSLAQVNLSDIQLPPLVGESIILTVLFIGWLIFIGWLLLSGLKSLIQWGTSEKTDNRESGLAVIVILCVIVIAASLKGK